MLKIRNLLQGSTHIGFIFPLEVKKGVPNPTYLRGDELTMIFVALEEINTLAINAVSGNDSAIHVDGEINIQ